MRTQPPVRDAVRLPRLAALLGLPVVLLAFLAALVVQAGPAAAATVTVTLTDNGPSPTTVTITAGDVVKFVNGSSFEHKVARTAGPWAFNKTLAPGASASTAPFASACTCVYNDTFTFLLARTVEGRVVVKAAPKPSASASPKPGPTKSAAPRRTTAPTTRPTATTSPTPVGGNGTAGLPGIGSGVVVGGFDNPTPQPGVPRPDIARPGVSASPAAPVEYSSKGLVQQSPHRYGLPAALAVVGITGVVSLLVRLLLAEPAAQRLRERGAGPPPVTVEPGGSGA